MRSLNYSGTISNGGFPGGSVIKNLPAKQETQVRSLGQEDAPREGKSNPLQYSCKIPQTEEPGGLQSMRSQRVRHDLATNQQRYPKDILASVRTS